MISLTIFFLNIPGYFPDNATSHVFPRLPGKIGYYLALTASKLKGMWKKIATPSSNYQLEKLPPQKLPF